MAWEVHHVREADVPAFARTVYGAFGRVADDDDMAHAAGAHQPDFALAISDQGRIVATASALPLELTVPAARGHAYPTVAAPGVTAVSVAATHRRQGLLTTLMNHQLADFRQRGYPVAVLLASESIIYGRFGYGWAQSYQSLMLETRYAAFRPSAPATPGRLRLIDRDEAGKLLPSVHEQARRLRPGELSRSPRWWDLHLRDPEKDREGAGGRMYAVHESAQGAADGWVSYRYRPSWPAGIPRHQVEIDDLVALDAAGLTALWRFVLDLDLVEQVSAPNRPADEPLRWLLADPRRLRTTDVADHLWLRVIDIQSALEARGYGSAERLVVDVAGIEPTAGGRFVLESGPTSGSCRPAHRGENAQLGLGLAELGAIYLGGIAPSALAAAGRVNELQPGALAAADRVFASPVAPFCTLHF
ncbi:MAG: GNAT family N-acetyltransferase [Actinomycetota bacterium]|nr:GNAT family N-acetyltransferase [Actinomycetota bacterium]